MTQLKDVQKILIIQLRRIGDVLLTTPVIKVLREHYPQSHIAFLTNPMSYDVLSGNPYLDEIIVCQNRDIAYRIKLIQSIRQKRFDVVFDFLGTPGTALISFLSGANYRVGLDLRYRGKLYNIRVKRDSGAVYIINSKLNVLKEIGIISSSYNNEMFFFIPQEAKERVSDFLMKKGVSNKDMVIMIAPLSRNPCLVRAWGKEKYAELADKLIIKYKAKIVFIWSYGEREEIEDIVKLMKEKPIISFETSLKEVAALIQSADLFISNDGGAMHIAIAVGTPTLTIYGPSDERSWCPIGPKHKAIRSEVVCMRCGKEICPDMFCMKNLDVHTVLESVAGFRKVIPKLCHQERD